MTPKEAVIKTIRAIAGQGGRPYVDNVPTQATNLYFESQEGEINTDQARHEVLGAINDLRERGGINAPIEPYYDWTVLEQPDNLES